jgi:ketosteroid isomerase-like protein
MTARAAVWEKKYNAGNLAAVQALYATDGCRMPPNQEAVHGSEAILAQRPHSGQGARKSR